jgi:hypothetical protein
VIENALGMSGAMNWYQVETKLMAMTPEGKVKKKIVEQLKALGCYYFFPATGGYGKSGVPDIVGSLVSNVRRVRTHQQLYSR